MAPSRPVRSHGKRLKADRATRDLVAIGPTARSLTFILDTSNLHLRRAIAESMAPHRLLLLQHENGCLTQSDPPRGRLALSVIQRQADFGIWIDGHGERSTIVDERGDDVPPELLTVLLAAGFADRAKRPTVVLEPATPKLIVELLKRLFRVRRGHARCEPMFNRIQETGATFGGGPSGRFWFNDLTPTSCATTALYRLLEQLNAVNQPLSTVLYRIHEQSYDSPMQPIA